MKKLMSRMFTRFKPEWSRHLTDQQLVDLICNEGSYLDRLVARFHVANCWHCQLSKKNIEGPQSNRVIERDRALFDESVPDAPAEQFLLRLRHHLQQNASPSKPRLVRAPNFTLLELPPMNPALVACMVLSFAAVLSFYFWWQQRIPRIGENTLLVRAEKWDRPTTQGVVYQELRITMTKQSNKESIAHAVYRDAEGKRRAKRVTLNDTEEHLRDTLTQVGLDWEQPLSASGYQSWHDRQHVREDHIARAGSHLLRLTTTVPDGLVLEQSLTVRDTDFHPVKRTMELRDSSTVEIAEMDYKVLPWGAVNGDLFEPIESLNASADVPAGRVLSFPRIPATPSEGQLDEAELGALLILNRLRADTGEEIKVRHANGIVEVDGLVETEQRKRELQAQLNGIPHLTVSIRSLDDLARTPDQGGTVSSVKVAAMQNQPSSLDRYLETRGQSINDATVFAEEFTHTAQTISQESKAISDLRMRFASDNQRSVMASATLTELIYSHQERLEAALRDERKLVSEVLRSEGVHGAPAGDKPTLVSAAEKNLALSKELIETDNAAPRSAATILAEMLATVEELAVASQAAYEKPQSNSALSGKK